MLESVKLTNFRCFRSAEVRLGPLTALVGPNASGKSALLDAITDHSLGNEPADIWQHSSQLPCKIEWIYDSHTGALEFGGGKPGQKQRAPKAQLLHLDPRAMRQANKVKDQPVLTEDGANLTNVVATLGRRKQEELVRELCELVPVLQDVTPRPASPGQHRLVFQDRWNDDVWYEPGDVSDGTILTLGLLCLRHQSSPADLVAIEEPERGLHPYLLGEMVGVLRKLALGQIGGKAMQVVLATQSSELLEFLEPEEVRFLSRNADDGSVSIDEAPINEEDWRKAYEAHQESLGSLWLSGSIGGVPGS